MRQDTPSTSYRAHLPLSRRYRRCRRGRWQKRVLPRQMANFGLIYLIFCNAHLIKAFFTDPNLEPRWGDNDDGAHENPDDNINDDERKFCEAFEEWRKQCFDQGSNLVISNF